MRPEIGPIRDMTVFNLSEPYSGNAIGIKLSMWQSALALKV